MALPAAKPRFTVEEYLRREEAASTRHEYHDGQILEMSSGGYEHSLIITNTSAALHGALAGKPCRALDSNLKIGIASSGRFVYPDISVVCGFPLFDARDPSRQTVTNPRLVVEVLSPSTESYDRGAKFDRYRELEAFEEYVLISQNKPAVQVFFRQSDGTWLLTPYAGIESTIKIRSLEIELPLRQVYAGVEFPADPGDEPVELFAAKSL